MDQSVWCGLPSRPDAQLHVTTLRQAIDNELYMKDTENMIIITKQPFIEVTLLMGRALLFWRTLVQGGRSLK